MNLNKLYEKQAKLDKYILENNWAREGKKMSKEELLDNTVLALLVEVGELANTTRCFKHWSTKGMMNKEIVLDEMADVLHFYLSIGNQIDDNITIFRDVESRIGKIKDKSYIIKRLYYWIVKFDVYHEYQHEYDYDSYKKIGDWIRELYNDLGFTDKEVEQAYLKKHEENYRRQREGY